MFERGRRDGDLGGMPENGHTGTRDTTGSTPGRPSSDGVAVIGRSIRINGDLRGEEDLRIEGDVSGTVELKKGNLTIGKEGKVKADVYAKSIMVDGTMEGDLYASERVNIRSHAHVRGNVTAPRVGIEDGAKFKGSIEMDQAAVDKALGRVGASDSSAKPAAVERAARTPEAPTPAKEAAAR